MNKCKCGQPIEVKTSKRCNKCACDVMNKTFNKFLDENPDMVKEVNHGKRK